MGIACQLRRPDTAPIRLIEPQLLEPQAAERTDRRNGATIVPVRMLDTQAREHIGRRVLHQRPDGELTEDPVWQWTSAPDRYLDTALRLELTSNPTFRLVDASDAPVLATTLLAWHLESAPQTQLVAAVEFQFTGPTVSFRRRWCEQVSRCQRSSPAIWPPLQAGSCAGSRWSA